MAKAGRKGKYNDWLTDDALILIEGWARDGLTEAQIAHNMGISEWSLNDWKRKFPQISSALKRGKAPVDYEVENSLLKSARGYTVKVKKPIKLKTKKQLKDKGTIEEEHIEYVEEEVYIKPDTTAQIFWLKNRRPDRWRDRQDQIITHIEDLQPLAEMLNEPDADDSMETVFEEA